MRMTCRTLILAAAPVLAAAPGLAAAEAAAQTAAAESDGAAVRIGADNVVRAGERVEEVVTVFGSATVEGEVDGDVVTVFGSAALGDTARVGGDFVVVSGSAEIDPGAVVDGDVVVVLGGLEAPAAFTAGGEQVVIGSFGFDEWLAPVGPWLQQGLLWGRPLAPELPWVWSFIALVGLIYLVVGVVFERPVRACAEALADKPLSTGLAGVLVMLLVVPVSIILCISIIGLVLVPLLLCAVFLAGLIGRVGAARWIGGLVAAERAPVSRAQAARSVAIGVALVSLAYLVPVLGIVTWTVMGVLGLGAAATTFIAGVQRENPVLPQARRDAGPPPPDAPGDGSAVPAAGADDDLDALPRAEFLGRLGAVLLDIVLVLITTALLDLHGGWFFLVFIGYHVVFWGAKGTTVGGIVFKLRVARADGGPVTWSEAVVRGLASVLSAAVAGLGWFWMLWDAERQTWHDRIAGTIVVREPHARPPA